MTHNITYIFFYQFFFSWSIQITDHFTFLIKKKFTTCGFSTLKIKKNLPCCEQRWTIKYSRALIIFVVFKFGLFHCSPDPCWAYLANLNYVIFLGNCKHILKSHNTETVQLKGQRTFVQDCYIFSAHCEYSQ